MIDDDECNDQDDSGRWWFQYRCPGCSDTWAIGSEPPAHICPHCNFRLVKE